MPFRLGAAAAMAAISATLVLMIVKAVVAPPDTPDIAGREAFLLQHIVTGLGGGLVLQLIYRQVGVPSYAGGLAWGLGGFLTVVLMPWLVLPLELPGAWPRDAVGLLIWLFTALCTGIGFALLWLGRPVLGLVHPGRHVRILGAGLLLMPMLVVSSLPEWTALPAEADDPLAGLNPGLDFAPGTTDAALGVELSLALDLLFWLLLGFFSVLATRRVVQRQG
ncbi:CbtA family protein [Ferrovibrio sp.]|jgi:predicted cobalt transporter CbtA|uniref:CbtA family protein n=1 Tax=Ferrovibrio sp. TaxID=1917215 RepID=UPI0035AFE3D9